jgi:hypothetical protein
MGGLVNPVVYRLGGVRFWTLVGKTCYQDERNIIITLIERLFRKKNAFMRRQYNLTYWGNHMLYYPNSKVIVRVKLHQGFYREWYDYKYQLHLMTNDHDQGWNLILGELQFYIKKWYFKERYFTDFFEKEDTEFFNNFEFLINGYAEFEDYARRVRKEMIEASKKAGLFMSFVKDRRPIARQSLMQVKKTYAPYIIEALFLYYWYLKKRRRFFNRSKIKQYFWAIRRQRAVFGVLTGSNSAWWFFYKGTSKDPHVLEDDKIHKSLFDKFFSVDNFSFSLYFMRREFYYYVVLKWCLYHFIGAPASSVLDIGFRFKVYTNVFKSLAGLNVKGPLTEALYKLSHKLVNNWVFEKILHNEVGCLCIERELLGLGLDRYRRISGNLDSVQLTKNFYNEKNYSIFLPRRYLLAVPEVKSNSKAIKINRIKTKLNVKNYINNYRYYLKKNLITSNFYGQFIIAREKKNYGSNFLRFLFFQLGRNFQATKFHSYSKFKYKHFIKNVIHKRSSLLSLFFWRKRHWNYTRKRVFVPHFRATNKYITYKNKEVVYTEGRPRLKVTKTKIPQKAFWSVITLMFNSIGANTNKVLREIEEERKDVRSYHKKRRGLPAAVEKILNKLFIKVRSRFSAIVELDSDEILPTALKVAFKSLLRLFYKFKLKRSKKNKKQNYRFFYNYLKAYKLKSKKTFIEINSFCFKFGANNYFKHFFTKVTKTIIKPLKKHIVKKKLNQSKFTLFSVDLKNKNYAKRPLIYKCLIRCYKKHKKIFIDNFKMYDRFFEVTRRYIYYRKEPNFQIRANDYVLKQRRLFHVYSFKGRPKVYKPWLVPCVKKNQVYYLGRIIRVWSTIINNNTCYGLRKTRIIDPYVLIMQDRTKDQKQFILDWDIIEGQMNDVFNNLKLAADWCAIVSGSKGYNKDNDSEFYNFKIANNWTKTKMMCLKLKKVKMDLLCKGYLISIKQNESFRSAKLYLKNQFIMPHSVVFCTSEGVNFLGFFVIGYQKNIKCMQTNIKWSFFRTNVIGFRRKNWDRSGYFRVTPFEQKRRFVKKGLFLWLKSQRRFVGNISFKKKIDVFSENKILNVYYGTTRSRRSVLKWFKGRTFIYTKKKHVTTKKWKFNSQRFKDGGSSVRKKPRFAFATVLRTWCTPATYWNVVPSIDYVLRVKYYRVRTTLLNFYKLTSSFEKRLYYRELILNFVLRYFYLVTNGIGRKHSKSWRKYNEIRYVQAAILKYCLTGAMVFRMARKLHCRERDFKKREVKNVVNYFVFNVQPLSLKCLYGYKFNNFNTILQQQWINLDDEVHFDFIKKSSVFVRGKGSLALSEHEVEVSWFLTESLVFNEVKKKLFRCTFATIQKWNIFIKKLFVGALKGKLSRWRLYFVNYAIKMRALGVFSTTHRAGVFSVPRGIFREIWGFTEGCVRQYKKRIHSIASYGDYKPIFTENIRLLIFELFLYSKQRETGGILTYNYNVNSELTRTFEFYKEGMPLKVNEILKFKWESNVLDTPGFNLGQMSSRFFMERAMRNIKFSMYCCRVMMLEARLRVSELLAFFFKKNIRIEFVLSQRVQGSTALFMSHYLKWSPRTYRRMKHVVRNAMRVMYSYMGDDVLGFKLQLAGRFVKTQRAAYVWRSKGALLRRTYRSRLDYSWKSVVMKYGVVCFKVWLLKGTQTSFSYQFYGRLWLGVNATNSRVLEGMEGMFGHGVDCGMREKEYVESTTDFLRQSQLLKGPVEAYGERNVLYGSYVLNRHSRVSSFYSYGKTMDIGMMVNYFLFFYKRKSYRGLGTIVRGYGRVLTESNSSLVLLAGWLSNFVVNMFFFKSLVFHWISRRRRLSLGRCSYLGSSLSVAAWRSRRVARGLVPERWYRRLIDAMWVRDAGVHILLPFFFKRVDALRFRLYTGSVCDRFEKQVSNMFISFSENYYNVLTKRTFRLKSVLKMFKERRQGCVTGANVYQLVKYYYRFKLRRFYMSLKRATKERESWKFVKPKIQIDSYVPVVGEQLVGAYKKRKNFLVSFRIVKAFIVGMTQQYIVEERQNDMNFLLNPILYWGMTAPTVSILGYDYCAQAFSSKNSKLFFKEVLRNNITQGFEFLRSIPRLQSDTTLYLMSPYTTALKFVLDYIKYYKKINTRVKLISDCARTSFLYNKQLSLYCLRELFFQGVGNIINTYFINTRELEDYYDFGYDVSFFYLMKALYRVEEFYGVLDKMRGEVYRQVNFNNFIIVVGRLMKKNYKSCSYVLGRCVYARVINGVITPSFDFFIKKLCINVLHGVRRMSYITELFIRRWEFYDVYCLVKGFYNVYVCEYDKILINIRGRSSSKVKKRILSSLLFLLLKRNSVFK